MSPTLGYTAAGGNMLGSLLGISPPAAGSTTDNAIAIGNANPAAGATSKPGALAGLGSGQAQHVEDAAPTDQGIPAVAAPQTQQSALDAFANSTGMDFMREQGIKALEGSQAGRGMLQSGATGTKLIDFGTKLGSTYLNQYIDRLLDYSKLGLGGASAMTSAGGWSKGTNTGTSSGGKEGALPQIAAAAAQGAAMASDIRLKQNIIAIGKTDEGIPLYAFDYIPDMGLPEGRQIGPMAHEVKTIKPEAFIPSFYRGYNGVRYDKIGKL
jgi:hypothetical protein